MSGESGERLQKALAHAGVASRRAAEALIAAGRVTVNGEVVREMGRRVLPADRIAVDGTPVEGPERHVYLALNKPINYVSTIHDPAGRPTVRSLVDVAERVYPVGRLDWDTEGLLLLTNDGELAHRLTHPRYAVEKEYHALVAGYPNLAVLGRLARGVELEDGVTAPAEVRRLRQGGDGMWLAITLHEGRNRQVRRMLDAVRYPARRLVRVRVGPIELGRLPVGQWRELSAREVEALRRLTGLEPGAPSSPSRGGARRPAIPAVAPASRRRRSQGDRGSSLRSR
ncbi:MAG TPA: pseudouridine synthase [Chloroflexota bacterium]|nr:pseudouridine synthase [Chloroflexota bacterium]